MSIVKYGEWEIEVDIERTKQYYNTLSITEDGQPYRNFTKCCKSLTDKEQEVFNSFAIKPLICNIEAVGTSKKNLPCGGYYYIYINYISTHKEIVWTSKQLVENDFIDDRPDPR